MKRVVGTLWFSVWLAAASGGPGLAQASPDPPGPTAAGIPPAAPAGEAPLVVKARTQLENAERLVTELKFDEALAASAEALAAIEQARSQGGPPLGGFLRPLQARAHDLRAQAYLSLGNSNLADREFDALVRADPAYALDERLLSPKIVARFKKLRAPLVGSLKITCRPSDLRLSLDGLPLACPAEPLPVLAGTHTLSAERAGFEPGEFAVTVATGEEAPAAVSLVPNARTLTLRTVPPGVEIFMDEKLLGVSSPDPAAAAVDAAESLPFVIEAVPPGEHRFRLRGDCLVEQLRTFAVVVDMMDLRPVDLKTVVLPPARSSLSVRTDPPGAEIFLEGEPLGPGPIEAREVCAGTRLLEARFAGGTRWARRIELTAGGSADYQASPRPDLRESFVRESGPACGPDDPAVQALRERLEGLENFNVIVDPTPGTDEAARAREAVIAGAAAPARDAETPDSGPAPSGDGAGLTLETRLLAGGPGDRVRFTISSAARARPEVREFDLGPPAGGPPAWQAFLDALDAPLVLRAPAMGALLVDVGSRGGPTVLEVRSGSPAASAGLKPGDEIVSVSGKPAANAAQARREILAGAAGPVSLTVRTGATERELRLTPAASPVVAPLGPAPSGSLHALAARARTLAASGPEADRPYALLALGQTLLRLGEPGKALRDALQRVDLPEGPGVSRATALYFSALAHEAAGSKSQAASFFATAMNSPEATLEGLDGPRLATAARVRSGQAGAGP